MPDWAFRSLLVASVLGLIAAIWRAHEKRDEERFTDVWNQIGRDSKSGMREVVHRTANQMSRVAPEVVELKERVDRLGDRIDER